MACRCGIFATDIPRHGCEFLFEGRAFYCLQAVYVETSDRIQVARVELGGEGQEDVGFVEYEGLVGVDVG